MIRTLADIGDTKGKRVLVRVDWNVPITEDGVITSNEAWRITQSLRTIHFLMERGARVIIISHFGRKAHESLKPVHEYLLRQEEHHIGFVPSLVSADIPAIIEGMGEGTALLLENVRSHEGEVTNDATFAALLASYADYYVNDAFSATHRAHASVVGVPQLLPAFAGLQFMDELNHLQSVRTPQHKAVVIMGGAKFETKLPVIEYFLATADAIALGGALANTLLQAQGYEVGGSIVDGVSLVTAFKDDPKIIIPHDVVVIGLDGQARVVTTDDVAPTDVIVDIGPITTQVIIENIATAKTVLWNGPLGWYEKGYTASTFAIADALAASAAVTIVGGGDTVTALYERDALNKISFVSTAGGAMLEYLAQGTLPGIESLS